MQKGRCLIIAEAGVNHNGSLDNAYKLCDIAKEAGADVVKFQTWITDNIITKSVEQASYQKENTRRDESQYEMLKRLELGKEDFRKIKEHCDSIGITFASTADDEESLDFLISLGIPFIKIGSGDILNVPFLEYIGSKNMPVILSTGMSSIQDVELSLNALRCKGEPQVTLLHCTTDYPCNNSDVNLLAMQTLEERFKVDIGYSDHTEGHRAAVAAVSLGARVIEKHFTIDKNMEGPDHKASLNPEELREYISEIRKTEELLGNGEKKPTENEIIISEVVIKRIVAKRKIEKGTVISEDVLTVKRNDRGLKASMWKQILGTIAIRDFNEDEGLEM